MRRRIVGIIYRKELRETLRDRRTLLTMVGLPLLVYPLLIVGLGSVTDAQEAASEARPSKVALWGEAPAGLLAQIESAGDIRIVRQPAMPAALAHRIAEGAVAPPPVEEEFTRKKTDAARQPEKPDHPAALAARPFVLDRTLDAVLLLWPGFARAEAQGGLPHASLLYDSVRNDSRKARERLARELGIYRRSLLEGREREHRLPAGFVTGLETHFQNVASSTRRSGGILGSMLPYLLMVISLVAGFYSAIDLTAGEKERGTMQTLMCAPIGAGEIILGKFLAVWTIALIGTLANVGSFAATFARLSVPGVAMKVSPSAYLLAFALLVPVSCMVTAIYLAIAALARDFKDGQNYLTPVLMGMMLPLAVTMIPSIELNPWTVFVPLVNIALLIKASFLAEARPDLVFLTLLASLLYAGLALAFAARVFARENVLLGGRESIKALFGLERRPGERPSPSMALVLFALVMVISFYGSALLASSGAAVSIVVVEYGFFLAPNLALIALMRFPLRETLALRLPPVSGLAASILLGLSAWTLAGGLLVRLLPPPESLSRALERILLLDGKPFPVWVLWLAVAITPAVCEELLFRGFLLHAFRGLGKWGAIALSGLLFGLAHSSIYRLLPTLFLGLVFGFVVWQTRSVVCGMVAHALNNGLMVTLMAWVPKHHPEWVKGVTYLPWSVIGAGALVFALGLLLVVRPVQPATGKA